VYGQVGAAGIVERYTSWRALAGLGFHLPRMAGADSRLKVSLVAAQPERLDVRFDKQLFDDASFSTKSAYGCRLSFSVQPGSESK
jgi:hypothetical protein